MTIDPTFENFYQSLARTNDELKSSKFLKISFFLWGHNHHLSFFLSFIYCFRFHCFALFFLCFFLFQMTPTQTDTLTHWHTDTLTHRHTIVLNVRGCACVMCLCERERERERERDSEREGEGVCVCVCERERERERESVCVCVCAWHIDTPTPLHILYIWWKYYGVASINYTYISENHRKNSIFFLILLASDSPNQGLSFIFFLYKLATLLHD